MTRRRNRSNNQRRSNRSNVSRNPGVGGLLGPNGEVRTFHFSAGAVKTSKEILFNTTNVPQLKHELSGIAEYKVVSISWAWEPLVPPGTDHGMVGLIPGITPVLITDMPKDVDSLFNAGMTLRPASTRRSTPSVGGDSLWYKHNIATGALYVYCTKTNTSDVGRISGVATIRVRGVGPP